MGGGYAAIPLIQSQIVDIHGLMTMEEFTDLITIAEMTPGPISINSSTFVGTRLAGPFGAVLCTLGCILPSFIICLTLAHFYYKYRSFSGVQTVLSALRPAVVALIASAGASILMLGLFQADIHSFQLETSIGWSSYYLACAYLSSASGRSVPSPSFWVAASWVPLSICFFPKYPWRLKSSSAFSGKDKYLFLW